MVMPTRPWPDPQVFGDITSYRIKVAKCEINKHADSLNEWLFWKYGKGPTITVVWPVGPVSVPNGDNAGMLTESADPNDHFRPWLEKNVGQQNKDWTWKIGPHSADNGFGTRGFDTLLIKFSRRKAKWSSIAVLLWA